MKDNITSVGDVIKETLTNLEGLQKRINAFQDELKEKIAALHPEYCEKHPEQQLEVNEESTFGHSWKNQSLIAVYRKCKKCKREKEREENLAKWLALGIPKKLLHATFDNFDTNGNEKKKSVLEKFKRQIKTRSGFIIALGTYGTGKSHLAAATIRCMGGGIFITEHDLIGELRQTYTDNSGQDDMVSRYRSTKVLVLDELTPDVKGTDISPLLYRVLGYRHDHDLLTVITSNDDLATVKAILGPKLEDRMRENTIICNFVWESNRKPAAISNL